MKICLITTHLPPKKGGVESHNTEFFNFIKKNNNFFLDVFSYGNYKKRKSEYSKKISKNIILHVFNIKSKYFYYLLNDLKSISNIYKNFIRSFLFLILNFYYITTICLKNKHIIKKSDLIFSVGALSEALPSYILSIIFNKKLLVEWHTQLSFFKKNIFSKILLKLIFKKSSYLIVNGRDIYLEAKCLGAEKIYIRKHYINYNIFKPIKIRKKIDKNNLILLYAAPLNETKFADILYDTMKNILEKRKDFKFIIIGRGNLQNNFLNLKKKYKSNIIFLNKLVSQKKLNYFINISDLVFASADVYYPGRLMLESICAGKPVIIINVSQHNRNKKIKFNLNIKNTVFKINPSSYELYNFLVKNKNYLKKISFENKLKSIRRNYIIRNYSKNTFNQIINIIIEVIKNQI